MTPKEVKDLFIKIVSRGTSARQQLVEFKEYFTRYKKIDFTIKKGDGQLIAISKNYRNGGIVTAGRDKRELDENIRDAILTVFSIPSVYSKEAGLHKAGDKGMSYTVT